MTCTDHSVEVPREGVVRTAAGLGEMSRDRLRLGRCALRLLEQAFGRRALDEQ
jgi:hypothetical protein